MQQNNGNKLAFPRPYSEDTYGDVPRAEYAQQGISYREWLIGQALTGILTRPDIVHAMPETIAKWAIHAADQVLAELYPLERTAEEADDES